MGKYEVKIDKGNIVLIKTCDTLVEAVTLAATEHGIIISEGR